MLGLDDLAAATLISGGASALGNIFGSLLGSNAQSNANKMNARLAMYQNEVNRENWRMANEYNSPIKQMQRLRDAGLNPNLVYENGASGNSSSSVPSSDVPRMQAYTNFGDLGASQITNSLMTAAQIQQMEKQNKNLEIDYAAKRQQMLRESIRMARDIMENKYYSDTRDNAKSLMDLSVSQARQNLFNSQETGRKLAADIQLTQARVATEKLRPSLTLAEYNMVMARLPGAIAEAEISQKSAKDYEEYGIRPSDPIWARALANVLEDTATTSTGKPTAHQTVKRWVKEKIHQIFHTNPGGTKF